MVIERNEGAEEQRTPASESEDDGDGPASPIGRHSRRVSWSLTDTDEIVSPGLNPTPSPSSETQSPLFPESLLVETVNKSSILKASMTSQPPSTVETIRLETNSDVQKSSILKASTATQPPPTVETVRNETDSDSDEETTSTENTAANEASETIGIHTDQEPDSETPANTTIAPALPESNEDAGDSESSVSMDVPSIRLSPAWHDTGMPLPAQPMPTLPVPAEDPSLANERLRQKAARLKKALLAMQKLESIQAGQSLVKEYELRTEFESLYGDVRFLGQKRDRLCDTLRDLRAKNADLLRRERLEEPPAEDREAGVHFQSTRVADASVQTDEWPSGKSVRSDPTNQGFGMPPRPVVS